MTKLIDVSQWNGNIDWQKVKAAGYHAIIRCGYGSNYNYQDDLKFTYNANQCEKLGIPYGIYLYSYAQNHAQAISEAKHALRLAKGRNLSYPIYIDVEEEKDKNRKFAKKACKYFAKYLEKRGYWVGVYANENWWKNYLKGMNDYTKWVAKYSNEKPSVTGCDIWQYTSQGKVKGVKGNVDVNIVNRDLVGDIKKSRKKKKK